MMRKSIKNSLNIILAASLLMSCSASNDAPDTLADGSHAVKLDMRVGVSAGVVTGSRELDTWDWKRMVKEC
jgi:major membrane immunogen (membrane-anchored lipoprotein)